MAIDEFLTRFRGLVWTIARTQITNRAELEDVVQEIFVDLWCHAARYDELVAAEETFVAMIARRRLIDHRRRQQRRITTKPMSAHRDWFVSEIPDSDEFATDLSWAREQLALLPSIERRILELAIDDNLSQKQIAERLGIPLGTVKTIARRVMIRLRKLGADSPMCSRSDRIVRGKVII